MAENNDEESNAITESDVESMKKSFNAKVNDTIEWKLVILVILTKKFIKEGNST